jgi:Circularly permutated YpsA SLOG family
MFLGAGRQRTGESMTGTTWLSSQLVRILREPGRTSRKSDGTVIFSLERPLSGGTKLTLEHANKLGKAVLHIYDIRKERILIQDSLRLEIQALTDFLCSNKSEVLNVAGPRESKEPGVYEWTLTTLRLFLSRCG